MFSSSRLEQWAGITTARQGIPLGQSLKEGAELCTQACMLCVTPWHRFLLFCSELRQCGLFGNMLGTPAVCVSIATARWNVCMWRTDADVTVPYLVNVSMCVFWKAPCQSSMALLIRSGILWLAMEGPQLVQILFHGHFLVTPEGKPRTELGHSVSAVVFDRSHWVGIRNPLQISQWEGLLLVLFLKIQKARHLPQ